MNWIIGKKYMLDEKYNSRGEVVLLWAGRLFGRVQDPITGQEWDVMLNRLSEA
jgi:hypothetical protein